MCIWTISAPLRSVLAYNFVEVAGCVTCTFRLPCRVLWKCVVCSSLKHLLSTYYPTMCRALTRPGSSITGMDNMSSPPEKSCKAVEFFSVEEGRLCNDDEKSENKMRRTRQQPCQKMWVASESFSRAFQLDERLY